MAARRPRYLLICQDNLLKNSVHIAFDYLSTGITITPFGKSERSGMAQIANVLRRFLFGQYDYVILPAINFRWEYDPSPIRRRARRFLEKLMAIKPNGSTPLVRWLMPKKTVVCVLDRYDHPTVRKEYAQMVGADLYLKSNLTVAEQQAQGNCPPRLGFLPFWIFPEFYPETRQQKDVDLFYAAALCSEARRLAKDEVDSLQRAGFRVVMPTERISPGEYISCLQRSYLTISPQGYGYNCFRHYEAMACGSVPVVNRPSRDGYVMDLVEGKNCLFYDAHTPGDLGRVVRAALQDKPKLQDWGQSLRSFALEHNSLEAVGDLLLRELKTVEHK